jgi:hypothetical protein
VSVLPSRLVHQRLVGTRLPSPAAVVEWLGAVQSQDLPGARWAVAQRTAAPSDAAVREALDAGTIVRTHVLRPTWHLVMAADVRWMLELTAPRIKNAAGAYYRQAGLTPKVFAQCHAVLARALEGGRHLTRRQIGAALGSSGRALEGQALGHVMMQAELDALVCSGASQGNQTTYALVDERVPAVKPMDREEALAKLAERYFRSHGPALLADFVWWSGLTVRDAKAGMAMASPALEKCTFDDRDYWAVPGTTTRTSPSAHVLPNFDEYTVAYRDRQLLWPSARPSMEALANVIAVDGRLAGFWSRSVAGGTLTVDVAPDRDLTAGEWRLLAREARRYAGYLDPSLELRVLEGGAPHLAGAV